MGVHLVRDLEFGICEGMVWGGEGEYISKI